MPKDEFDFEDPLELNGVGLVCEEDTSAAMTECFVEEFMRLGYNHKQILALFRNPHYLGMNLALEKRGEPFVRDTIADVFARRGKTVTWPASCRTGFQPVSNSSTPDSPPSPSDAGDSPDVSPASADNGDRLEACPTRTDPLGAPIPDVTI